MYTPRIAVYTPRYKIMHQFHSTHRTEAKATNQKLNYNKEVVITQGKANRLKLSIKSYILTAEAKRKQQRKQNALRRL